MDVPARIRAGEPVLITLEVANVSGNSIDLYLTGREITADIVVRDASGRTVWRKLEGAVTQAILQLKPLSAGESFALHERWDQRTAAGAPVAPGRYTVAAELLGEVVLRFPARTLLIVP